MGNLMTNSITAIRACTTNDGMHSELSFFCAVMNADESVWSNDVHRGEAGHCAAWLCEEQIIWAMVLQQAHKFFLYCLHAERYTQHTMAPFTFSLA
jgi:hypothetical protein